MPKLKYVGLKEDGETAFHERTGIPRWMPGDAHNITEAALVARMLQHPDVFALVTEEDAPAASVSLSAGRAASKPAKVDAATSTNPIAPTTVANPDAGAGMSLAPGGTVGVGNTSPAPGADGGSTAALETGSKAKAAAPAPAKKAAAKKTGKGRK